MVPIHELKEHPKNRNKHPDDQIKRLAAILKYQGWRYPVKVSNRSHFVTSGHGRILAAKKNGWKEVPVSYQDYESEEQEYADLQSDNAIASWAELDLSGINSDIGDLGPDFDINLLGIKDFVLEPAEKLAPGCDEDEVPEKVEPRTKLGDVYQLGPHRLMCGDSTSIDAVEKLMNGKFADICFTSPPYNAGAAPGGLEHARHRKYLNNEMDKKSEDEYRLFLNDFLSIAMQFSVLQFVNLAFLEGGKRSIIGWLSDKKDFYCDQMIWKKKSSAPSPPNVLTHNHEMILIFSKEQLPNRRLITKDFSHAFSVLEIDRNEQNEFAKYHHATFPVKLAEAVIELSSVNSVYEPFGGSGTTLIACEKLSHTCFIMELDPHYCDIIVERWEKFSGKKAELING